MLGHRFVGEEHEVLNEEIRGFALLKLNLDGVTVLIQTHFNFSSIKLYRALRRALRTDFFRQGMKDYKLAVHIASPRIEGLLGVFISIAFVGVDDGFTKPSVNNIRLRIEGEDGRDREPVLVWV